jgi:ornithine cyclodeaminase/alanine dehydrogenase-like protein (mu-crystallin family)
VLILTRADIEAALDPPSWLDAVSVGFQALSAGAADAPPRQAVSGEDGSVLVMGGRVADGPIAVKLVGVFPGNAAVGLDVHLATVVLLDATTGRALALMDGEVITALRTAAGSALATRACAREDVAVLAVVGSGVQARAHLQLLPLVRSFGDVRLVARDPAAAARLGVAPGTVKGADVICLCTGSATPVLAAADVAPGTHVNSVGVAPPGGELDPARAARARLIVETRGAFSDPPAGAAELAGLDPSLGIELGEVLAGRIPGRTSDEEITVYKSIGHITEDAAAARLVYETALERGLGREISL